MWGLGYGGDRGFGVWGLGFWGLEVTLVPKVSIEDVERRVVPLFWAEYLVSGVLCSVLMIIFISYF